MAVGDDFFHYRQVGTGGGFGKRWYNCGSMGSYYYGLGATSCNGVLHAHPFHSGRGVTIEEAGTYCSTGTSTLVRFGLYEVEGEPGNLYPTTLRVDFLAATVADNTFVKRLTLAHVVPANKILMAAMISNGTHTFTSTDVGTGAAYGNSLGLDVSSDPSTSRQGITVTQAYGVLPATFPAGGALATNVAAPWFYFSA